MRGHLPALVRRLSLLALFPLVGGQCDVPLECPVQDALANIHTNVQAVCCIGKDCSGPTGLPSECSPDCAVRVQEWWDVCVVYLAGAPGYADFHNRCGLVFPPTCTVMLPTVAHGNYGTCPYGGTVDHSCGCNLACDEGYGLVGSQPYCEQGFLSSTARCAPSGCTDSLAINYSPLAEYNNGSCTYGSCNGTDPLRPTLGGGAGTCSAGAYNLTHGEGCELTCADAGSALQCEVLAPPGALPVALPCGP
jgi:hypothetical protein